MQPILNYQTALGDKYLVAYQNRQQGKLSGGEADFNEKNISNAFFIKDMQLLHSAVLYSMDQNKAISDAAIASLKQINNGCSPETATIINMVPRIQSIGAINTEAVFGSSSDLF